MNKECLALFFLIRPISSWLGIFPGSSQNSSENTAKSGKIPLNLLKFEMINFAKIEQDVCKIKTKMYEMFDKIDKIEV